MTPTSLLQIALVWQEKILAYRLVDSRQKVTVGPSPRASLVTPPVLARGDRFKLLVPIRPRGRYRLRLTPAFRGEVTVNGELRTVADLLVSGKPSARDAGIREVEIGPGDKAKLTFGDAGGLRIEIRFVEPPALIPRPRLTDTEPFLARTIATTSLVMGLFLTAVIIFAPEDNPPRSVLTAERVAKLFPPAPPRHRSPLARRKTTRRARKNPGKPKKQKAIRAAWASATRRRRTRSFQKARRTSCATRCQRSGFWDSSGRNVHRDRAWRNCSPRNATSNRRWPE